MTKFSNKFKKPCFWHIVDPVSQFWGQKTFFPENLALSRTTSCGFLAPSQNLEATNKTIPRKRPDREKDERKDGWKGRHTLLYGTLLGAFFSKKAPS